MKFSSTTHYLIYNILTNRYIKSKQNVLEKVKFYKNPKTWIWISENFEAYFIHHSTVIKSGEMSGALVRKQPERKAKKRAQESMANSKSEKFSKVPRKRQFKSKMAMNPTSFDLIGELISNYGEITGTSLVHEIFSYLDFSTLQQIRLVRQSWNFFLTKDLKYGCYKKFFL